MTPGSTIEDRARLLAGRYPAAADVLSFYARLAEQQRVLADRSPMRGLEDEQVLGAIPGFLDWLTQHAPASLAESASDLHRLSTGDWREWLDRAFVEELTGPTPIDSAALFVVEAVTQPFARRVARAGDAPPPPRPSEAADARCPSCGCRPVAGVLREEGHGARRALVCARCDTEWSFPRVCCPGCGEQEFAALPVYSAEQFAHVLVEACDRCRRYVKTVDLTKDGLALPAVDDLASLPLDLWARDAGYVRLRANLLRL
jgi:formate dehydrogenase accessory protein FdhE